MKRTNVQIIEQIKDMIYGSVELNGYVDTDFLTELTKRFHTDKVMKALDAYNNERKLLKI